MSLALDNHIGRVSLLPSLYDYDEHSDRMTVAELRVPVLIVGGGPAGLTTSLLLSRYGVESLLIDKHTSPSPLPRARGVHARAMEILRVCGADGDMRAQELAVDPGAEWRPRLTDAPVKDVRWQPESEPSSPVEGLAMSQDVFETILRAHAGRYPGARLWIGTELVSWRRARDGVEAILIQRSTGRRIVARARYLVAADGARSAIRQKLGIAMEGVDDLGGHLTIAFRANLTPWTRSKPRGIYFLTDSSAALLWTHADDRWALVLPESRTADPALPAKVRQALGTPDLPLEVTASGEWTAAAQTARHYSRGPVFLIGDAAHRFPPVGANGISTAMADAHNLAWKMAAVLSGSAAESLLATYAEEREPVGRRNVEETGAAWKQVFQPNAAPFSARSLRQIDMGYQYRSAAIVSDGSPDADPPGADYKPNAAPGRRAPHVQITADNRSLSTIDLFDGEFVLLTAERRVWLRAAAQAAATLGVRVIGHRIVEPSWQRAYQVGPDGAVLVRPDGHVAWRCCSMPTPSDPTPEAQLRAALSTASHPTPGHADLASTSPRQRRPGRRTAPPDHTTRGCRT